MTGGSSEPTMIENWFFSKKAIRALARIALIGIEEIR
jgi:hypothetical protein